MGAQTVIILTGGCLFFGDEMPPEKLMGVLVAMAGIVWYSLLKIQETSGSRVDTARLPLTGEVHAHRTSPFLKDYWEKSRSVDPEPDMCSFQ